MPYLKAHLHSGDLLVFQRWSLSAEGSGLTGHAIRYDAQRRSLGMEAVTVPADSIALLETNRPVRVANTAHAALIAWSVASAAGTAYCLADPKACFGSCPTFYLQGVEGEALVAEGFSSSFARILERRDLDAIPTPDTDGSTVGIIMRNEAPETHAVRSVRLLAVPIGQSGSVMATGDGSLFEVGERMPALACLGAAGNCLQAVLESDGLEYFSLSDPEDLATRESLEIDVEAPPGARRLGLMIRARNSLLSTFLFYETIAALGSRAGDWLAAIERGDPAVVGSSLGLARELGPIEVAVRDSDGGWRRVGTFGEAGPLASDEQVVELGAVAGPIRVRLTMTRGNWRIDHLALVELRKPVSPIVIEPAGVEADGKELGPAPDPEIAEALRDPDRYLVTQRGDEYRLMFHLPGDVREYRLFLESRGYYYEWMREEWRNQEDPALVRLLFTDPASALRRLAPEYKSRESTMEAHFWASRFRRGAA